MQILTQKALQEARKGILGRTQAHTIVGATRSHTTALRALRQLQEPLPVEERTVTLVTASRLLGL